MSREVSFRIRNKRSSAEGCEPVATECARKTSRSGSIIANRRRSSILRYEEQRCKREEKIVSRIHQLQEERWLRKMKRQRGMGATDVIADNDDQRIVGEQCPQLPPQPPQPTPPEPALPITRSLHLPFRRTSQQNNKNHNGGANVAAPKVAVPPRISLEEKLQRLKARTSPPAELTPENSSPHDQPAKEEGPLLQGHSSSHLTKIPSRLPASILQRLIKVEAGNSGASTAGNASPVSLSAPPTIPPPVIDNKEKATSSAKVEQTQDTKTHISESHPVPTADSLSTVRSARIDESTKGNLPAEVAAVAEVCLPSLQPAHQKQLGVPTARRDPSPLPPAAPVLPVLPSNAAAINLPNERSSSLDRRSVLKAHIVELAKAMNRASEVLHRQSCDDKSNFVTRVSKHAFELLDVDVSGPQLLVAANAAFEDAQISSSKMKKLWNMRSDVLCATQYAQSLSLVQNVPRRFQELSVWKRSSAPKFTFSEHEYRPIRPSNERLGDERTFWRCFGVGGAAFGQAACNRQPDTF